MPRYVNVRYLTPVYATVDLDAEKQTDGYYPDDSVARIFHADSSVTRLDNTTGIIALTGGDVLDTSYESDRFLEDAEDVDPRTLTPAERAKALDVAEHTCWPMWEAG